MFKRPQVWLRGIVVLAMVAVTVTLVASQGVEARPPQQAQSSTCSQLPCIIDLKTGLFTPSCNSSFMNFVAVPTDSNSNGWNETVLKINLSPAGCTRACFVVEYEGTPSGWTVNIGDSSTNNGWGGDAATTLQDAEMQIKEDGGLSVFSADVSSDIFGNPVSPPEAQRLMDQLLRVKDGAIKICVQDQFLSWGQPFGYLTSPFPHLLYALGTPNDVGDNNTIYAGFNRVIFGPGERIGAGAAVVKITLE